MVDLNPSTCITYEILKLYADQIAIIKAFVIIFVLYLLNNYIACHLKQF